MKMISFKEFVKANDMDEEKKDIEKTLKKLPHSHASLVKGYKWKFHSGNTLNGDNQHVGYIDDSDKEIAVASPWNYGREFTILHEVGHKVWENFVTPQMKNQWNKIVANTKNKQEQEPEELFCHAYAATYCNQPPAMHYHKNWVEFIKNLPS